MHSMQTTAAFFKMTSSSPLNTPAAISRIPRTSMAMAAALRLFISAYGIKVIFHGVLVTLDICALERSCHDVAF